MKKLLLPLLMAGGLSAIYFLPKVGKVADSAVRMELPDEVGTWMFAKIPPSQPELKALAKDTEFSKAICVAPRRFEFDNMGNRVRDRVDLSIVLSGVDLTNSIHRPERCLPAQGHSILSASTRTLQLPNGRKFDVKRLLSVKSENTAAPGEKENYRRYQCVTYYFFVGHDQLSNDHLKRTLIDMKDRLVKGMDQRWAYISVSMPYGQVPWIGKEVPESEADEKLTDFVAKLAEEQIKWEQVLP